MDLIDCKGTANSWIVSSHAEIITDPHSFIPRSSNLLDKGPVARRMYFHACYLVKLSQDAAPKVALLIALEITVHISIQ